MFEAKETRKKKRVRPRRIWIKDVRVAAEKMRIIWKEMRN